jgi:hypothetical protein
MIQRIICELAYLHTDERKAGIYDLETTGVAMSLSPIVSLLPLVSNRVLPFTGSEKGDGARPSYVGGAAFMSMSRRRMTASSKSLMRSSTALSCACVTLEPGYDGSGRELDGPACCTSNKALAAASCCSSSATRTSGLLESDITEEDDWKEGADEPLLTDTERPKVGAGIDNVVETGLAGVATGAGTLDMSMLAWAR